MSDMILDAEYTGPRFRYGCINRPPMFATVPKGAIVQSLRCHRDFRHGTIDYPFQLSDDDTYRYELAYLGQFDTRPTVVEGPPRLF